MSPEEQDAQRFLEAIGVTELDMVRQNAKASGVFASQFLIACLNEGLSTSIAMALTAQQLFAMNQKPPSPPHLEGGAV